MRLSKASCNDFLSSATFSPGSDSGTTAVVVVVVVVVAVTATGVSELAAAAVMAVCDNKLAK